MYYVEALFSIYVQVLVNRKRVTYVTVLVCKTESAIVCSVLCQVDEWEGQEDSLKKKNGELRGLVDRFAARAKDVRPSTVFWCMVLVLIEG